MELPAKLNRKVVVVCMEHSKVLHEWRAPALLYEVVIKCGKRSGIFVAASYP